VYARACFACVCVTLSRMTESDICLDELFQMRETGSVCERERECVYTRACFVCVCVDLSRTT